MPEGAVYVGRPSVWGNRYRGTPAVVVDFYRQDIDYTSGALGPKSVEQIQLLLRGKDLVCWCPLSRPCHADVLLELANRPSSDEGTE
jgi:hypothetical protein